MNGGLVAMGEAIKVGNERRLAAADASALVINPVEVSRPVVGTLEGDLSLEKAGNVLLMPTPNCG